MVMTKDKKAKILYIEDDFASRQLVERVLNSRGYTVFLADDGLQGITIARESEPELILMDINLPNMDGREITTRLRSLPNFANTPIVALTANTSPGSRELALAAGCTGFMTKPIDVSTFPREVEAFLAGREEPLPDEDRAEHLKRHAQNIVERLEGKIRELEKVNQRLRELDSLKSDFILLVSHELRTPLTLVHGYAHLLEENLARADEMVPAENLAHIASGLTAGANRMQEVIGEIINVSRIASGKLDLSVGPVRFEHIVEDLEAQFREVCLNRRLNLHVGNLKQLPLIEGDGKLIKTAVTHVLQNAIKYTPDKGHIYIVGREVNDAVDLIIKDTGIGVPVEEQRHIFDQFYSLGAIEHHSTSKYAFQGGGLGLGLAIAKGIVEAHNGRIWVESERRDSTNPPGSTFHILLPTKQFTKS
ncbi:MAG: hybrid sensor histidine kinase/response regulator [Ardenticatenaceae bacterium]|nr:hybrid sensor histidine kinase/response regulator [Ardenticatenaceae bacterium]